MAGNLAAGGGNPSGFNVNQIAPYSGASAPMGTQGGQGGNPLMPAMPSQQQWPGISSPFSFPANSGSSAPIPGFSNLPGSGKYDDVARGLRDAGLPSNIASSLAGFIKSGSGYNPKVLQALFAQLQPQINRGESDILEHFGSMGLGMSSPAAIGLGDYLSQVNLNESQMATQLYEDSIKNYLSIMLGGSNLQSQDGPGFWGSLGESLFGKGIGALLGGAGSALTGGTFGAGFGGALGGG